MHLMLCPLPGVSRTSVWAVSEQTCFARGPGVACRSVRMVVGPCGPGRSGGWSAGSVWPGVGRRRGGRYRTVVGAPAVSAPAGVETAEPEV